MAPTPDPDHLASPTADQAAAAPPLGPVRGLLAASALLLAVPAVLSLLDQDVFVGAVAGAASGAYALVLAGTHRPDPTPALFAARLLGGCGLLFLLLAVLLPSLL